MPSGRTYPFVVCVTSLNFFPASRRRALAEHLQNNILAFQHFRAATKVAVADDGARMQAPLGNQVVMRLPLK
jgi:hypothetical protein